jgi:hypothetical protein
MAAQTPNVLTYDITCVSGDSLAISITWKDALGVPIDFTGCTALAQLKLNKDDALPVVVFTVNLGNGVANISYGLTAAQVLALGVGRWFYDIQITFPDGTVRTYIYGKLKIIQDVSRS